MNSTHGTQGGATGEREMDELCQIPDISVPFRRSTSLVTARLLPDCYSKNKSGFTVGWPVCVVEKGNENYCVGTRQEQAAMISRPAELGRVFVLVQLLTATSECPNSRAPPNRMQSE